MTFPINGRLDAAIWQCVDKAFTARETEDVETALETTKQAIRELDLEFHRARAAEFIDDGHRHDWLVDLMRETNPNRVGRRLRVIGEASDAAA